MNPLINLSPCKSTWCGSCPYRDRKDCRLLQILNLGWRVDLYARNSKVRNRYRKLCNQVYSSYFNLSNPAHAALKRQDFIKLFQRKIKQHKQAKAQTENKERIQYLNSQIQRKSNLHRDDYYDSTHRDPRHPDSFWF